MNSQDQYKVLWKKSFGDTDDFIDFVFKNVCKPEYACTIERNGKLISALQLIPYSLNYFGNIIKVGYIYGACTHPLARNQGFMRKLLFQVFSKMKREGYMMSIIVPAEPWLFDYYASCGFTNAFDVSESVYTLNSNIPGDSSINVQRVVVPLKLYPYFFERMYQRQCCVLHDNRDYENIIKELSLSKGKVFAAYRKENGQQIGMALVSRMDIQKGYYVQELFYEDNHVKDVLLQRVLKSLNVDSIVVREPFVPNSEHRCVGMAQIVDQEQMTKLYSQICSLTHEKSDSLKDLDVRELTSLVLRYPEHKAYMSLMLDF